MFLFALVFLAVALMLIGIGIVLGLVACVCGGLLLSLGVISSSVFVGMRSGRPALAMRAFVLQCGLLLGVPAGAGGAWLAQCISASVDPAYWTILGSGALGGAVGGLCVGWLLDLCLQQLHQWTVSKRPFQRFALSP